MIDTATFEDRLSFGHIGESHIAQWLINARGAAILPVYASMTHNDYKGPRVFTAGGNLVAPDLMIHSRGQVYWIEAKHKSVFSWYRIGGRWVTGIDRHHYADYQRVASLFGFPVWLLFLHDCSTPCEQDLRHPSCPSACPTGLFGNKLDYLVQHESHTSTRHGRHGMVYWGVSDLIQLASVDDVLAASGESAEYT